MIILDIETTSRDISRAGIIELAALHYEKPEYRFERLVQAQSNAHIDNDSLEFVGQTEEDIYDKKRISLGTAIRQFSHWAERIHDRTIAGLNIGRFDLAILTLANINYNPFTNWYRSIDLHSLVNAKYRELGMEIPLNNHYSNINGTTCYAFVGIPPEPLPHKAMRGVLWEAEAFSRLLEKKNLLKEFKEYPLPEYLLR